MHFESIDSVWKLSARRASAFLYHPEFIYKFSSMHREQTEILDYLTRLTPDVFKRSAETESGNDGKAAKARNLCDKLVEMERLNLIDRKRAFDQINTFAVAVSIKGTKSQERQKKPKTASGKLLLNFR